MARWRSARGPGADGIGVKLSYGATCLSLRYAGKKRRIVVYKKYFDEFFEKQRPKVRDKIIWTFELIEQLAVVPETYLKHLAGTSGLYEIRVQQGSDILRIFCFFDEGKLVVLINGLQKKTPKTPKVELQIAEKLKAAYYEEKS